MKKEYKTSFVNSFCVLVYITIVATIMQNGEKIFGKTDGWFTPIAVLLLFTLSACVVVMLLLGKPLMLYLDNKKKEAVSMITSSVAWLAIFTIIFLLILVLTK